MSIEAETLSLGEELKKKVSMKDLVSSCGRTDAYDTLSSDDEEYGDEQELMSIASTLRTAMPDGQSLPFFPPPLDMKFYDEPCGTSFRVRGKKYLSNKKKEPSCPSLFRLIAFDLCEVSDLIRSGFCAHPSQRVQQALIRERDGRGRGDMPPFIFCVNLMVPGPPNYHAVFYYAVDDISRIKLEEGEKTDDPFKNLASKFFFGSSDKFRKNAFKVVPRIVKGNIVVKKAVGSKPTLLGKKLEQSYIRGERFLEVMVDIGSSVIATKVVKLAKGYAKNLIVDLAFLLEGKHVECLPEKIMGTIRLNNLDFGESRFVDQP